MDYNLKKNKCKFVIPFELYHDKNYNILRRRILLLISELLYKHEDIYNIDYKERQNIVIQIELSCYSKTIEKSNELVYLDLWNNHKFVYLYRLYTNKVTKNLDKDSEVNNSYLLNKIIKKEIDLSKLAYYDSNTLCPEKSDKIINSLNERSKQKINYKITTLYLCSNCKNKCATIETVQLRSLDEGSNYSLTCKFCGKNWII